MKTRFVPVLIGSAVVAVLLLVSFLIGQNFWPPAALPLPVLAEEAPPTTVVLQPDSQAELISSDATVIANFPAASVTSPTTISLKMLSQTVSAMEEWRGTLIRSFLLNAVDEQGTPLKDLNRSFLLTLSYFDRELSEADESRLTLYFWDELSGGWVKANETCVSPKEPIRDLQENLYQVEVCQLGEFAFFQEGQMRRFSFLPLIAKLLGSGQTIQGSVTDVQGNPVPGVQISANGVTQTYTDEQGNFVLANLPTAPVVIELSKVGYQFPASGVQVDPAETPQLSFSALQQAGCYELIENGSFERNAAWFIHGSSYAAGYSTTLARSGSRSMRSGILTSGDNRYSFSLFSQTFDIPLNTTSVILRFHTYESTTESTTTGQNEPMGEIQTITYNPSGLSEPLAALDYNYAGLFDTNNNLVTANFLFQSRQKSTAWQERAYQLVNFDGRRIMLKMGTYNDGQGGVTGMFTDDVSLEVCVTPPAGTDLIVNGGFENNQGWLRLNPDNPALQPRYTTERKRNGDRSMFAGLPAGSKLSGYSPFEQLIAIPTNATNPVLKFWLYTQSAESNLTSSAEEMPMGDLALDSTPNNDLQYVAILDTNRKALQYLVWQRRNDQSWKEFTFDLSAYVGKTIYLRFGVYNDGDGKVTSMYVDDVSLILGSTPLPTPTATNTPIPTNTPMPTSTPTPVCGPNLLVNSGFENNTGWDRLSTPLQPQYTTVRKYQGDRSMFAGIDTSGSTASGYSIFQQMVTIPAGAANARLEFWMYPISAESNLTDAMEAMLDLMDVTAAPNNDVQYVAVLDTNGNLLQYLMWRRSNDRTWQQRIYSLGTYAGQTIVLRFGVANDGDGKVTSMFVDEAYLWACP